MQDNILYIGITMFRLPALVLLSALVFATACVQTTEATSDGGNTSSRYKWYDSLVMEYIQNTDNAALIQAHIEAMPLEWRFEGMVTSDSIPYMTFRVGHTDQGRFVTDDWLYIDSTRRLLYEFDTENDSISLFRLPE